MVPLLLFLSVPPPPPEWVSVCVCSPVSVSLVTPCPFWLILTPLSISYRISPSLSLPVSESSPAPSSPLRPLLSCSLSLLNLHVFPFPLLPTKPLPCPAPTLSRGPLHCPRAGLSAGAQPRASWSRHSWTPGGLSRCPNIRRQGCAHLGAFHLRFCTTSQTVIKTSLGPGQGVSPPGLFGYLPY